MMQFNYCLKHTNHQLPCSSPPTPPRPHAARAADEWAAVLSSKEQQAYGGPTEAAPPGPLCGGHKAHATQEESLVWSQVLEAKEKEQADRQLLPDSPVLYAAIECGSHSTRAVLHSGTRELSRLTYDTLLSRGLQQGGPLQAAGVDTTLHTLSCIAREIQIRTQRPLTPQGGKGHLPRHSWRHAHPAPIEK